MNRDVADEATTTSSWMPSSDTTGSTTDPEDTDEFPDSSTSMDPDDSTGDTGSTSDPDLPDDDDDDDDDNDSSACHGLDLLFVVDNSLSSSRIHRELARAFPGFVAHLRTAFADELDVHLGITTTSFYQDSCYETLQGCASTLSEEEVLAQYLPPQAGHTGENGGQGRLFQHEGRTYYAGSVADAGLITWFESATAAIGDHGCTVEVGTAAAAYVTHPANETTNAGFLRDEGALLIVVLVTDEPDKSPESMPDYQAMLTDAKQACGGARCILTGGLVNQTCLAGPDTTLLDFLTGFGHVPVLADTACLAGECDFTPVLGSALATMASDACLELDAER